MARIAGARIVDTAIDVPALAAAVQDESAGAVVTFEGVVRNHDGGRAVTSLEYTGHPNAGAILGDIAVQYAADHPDVRVIAVEHRVGHLLVGGCALAVAVSAAHRQAALAAVAALIDLIKSNLPVWKHQHFADGTAEWSNLP